jgi:hypothetical protein
MLAGSMRPFEYTTSTLRAGSAAHATWPSAAQKKAISQVATTRSAQRARGDGRSTLVVFKWNPCVLFEGFLALSTEGPDHDAGECGNEDEKVGRLIHRVTLLSALMACSNSSSALHDGTAHRSARQSWD